MRTSAHGARERQSWMQLADIKAKHDGLIRNCIGPTRFQTTMHHVLHAGHIQIVAQPATQSDLLVTCTCVTALMAKVAVMCAILSACMYVFVLFRVIHLLSNYLRWKFLFETNRAKIRSQATMDSPVIIGWIVVIADHHMNTALYRWTVRWTQSTELLFHISCAISAPNVMFQPFQVYQYVGVCVQWLNAYTRSSS